MIYKKFISNVINFCSILTKDVIGHNRHFCLFESYLKNSYEDISLNVNKYLDCIKFAIK